MADSGIGAMVHTAAWLQQRIGLELISCGKPADAKFIDCELVLSGKHLLYSIVLDHDWLFFGVALLDRADPLERLLSVVDDAESWQVIGEVVAAMERSELKSLVKPIHVGSTEGPGAWLIG